ncbi:MAG: hypothetical protein R3Y26_06825 [Rikenellaceae bacterium]
MIQKLTFIWLICIACTVSTVQAKPTITFASEHIESIYQKLPKTQDGEVINTIYDFNIKITKNNNTIQDLGIALDNIEFEAKHIKPFIERKLLELLLAKDTYEIGLILSHSKCQIYYNDIDYSNGLNWDLKEGVKLFRNFTSYLYQNNNDYCNFSLKNNQNEFEITFPINIQTLTDKNKMELELEFKDVLFSDYDVNIYEKPHNKSRYYKIDNIYVNSTDFFYVETINNATFYTLDEWNFDPVFSLDYEVESFINLFHFANDNTKHIDLDIKQWMYGNKNKEFTISLDKIISYCKTFDITVYVGIETRDNNLIESTILLEDKTMKFIHILHINTDITSLLKATSDNHGNAKVNLYAYIPTDNIENIFNDK